MNNTLNFLNVNNGIKNNNISGNKNLECENNESKINIYESNNIKIINESVYFNNLNDSDLNNIIKLNYDKY